MSSEDSERDLRRRVGLWLHRTLVRLGLLKGWGEQSDC